MSWNKRNNEFEQLKKGVTVWYVRLSWQGLWRVCWDVTLYILMNLLPALAG